MSSTYDIVLRRFQQVFDYFEEGADPVLRSSEHGDFQANGVMGLAKRLGRPPREVAAEIAERIDLADIGHVSVAGPGFLNVALREEFLGDQLSALRGDSRLGVPLSPSAVVVIDYSAPNVAKEMHVGHLRSTVIGDALARMKRFTGATVIARNHVGDWGTPFGMLIEHLLDLGEAAAIATLSIGDLDSFYRAARNKFDGDDSFKERSRARVVALQNGDGETRRLWSILVSQSVAYFSEVYRALDVTLTADDVVGESFYNDMLDGVVSDLDAAGLLTQSNGAWCVFPPGFTNREGEPFPLIVRKSDEGFGYAATDLAALRDRVSRLEANEILYVVGAPQGQHFDMIFAVARAAKWLPDEVICEHIAFGNVLGPDHKMFKTRSGQTVKLIGLLDEAVERAEDSLRQRRPQLDGSQRHALAVDIARAAIKYADLSTDRTRDYVFDLDRMIAFEGDTGPYLQYAHARIRSIFRRLEGPVPIAERLLLTEPAEHDLALSILGFPEALATALSTWQPHRLCNYLFDLAQHFTTFYEACSVLGVEGELRASRLELCDLSARTLALGLDLMGIAAPHQM